MPIGDIDFSGRVLAGRYRVEGAISRGGMGSVYRGVHIDLGRRVAIKILHPELAGEAEHLVRFRREAEATARLRHPHIVEVTDIGTDTSAPPFLVMELLEGRSLSATLRPEGRLGTERAVRITLQLLSALSAAHAAGVVHRDIKPANVLLVTGYDGGEVAKLVDFGVAKLMESTGYTRLTATGQVIGTPRYMAAEQLLGEPVDGRTDLYAVGVLLYSMLAGLPPFRGSGYAELVPAILAGDPVPLEMHRPDVSPALLEVVRRAMARHAEQRFADAGEMSTAIARATGAVVPAAGAAASGHRVEVVPTRSSYRPGAASERPEMAPTRPSQRPGAASERPEMAPTRPSQRPGAASERPEMAPTRPSQRPGAASRHGELADGVTSAHGVTPAQGVTANPSSVAPGPASSLPGPSSVAPRRGRPPIIAIAVVAVFAILAGGGALYLMHRVLSPPREVASVSSPPAAGADPLGVVPAHPDKTPFGHRAPSAPPSADDPDKTPSGHRAPSAPPSTDDPAARAASDDHAASPATPSAASSHHDARPSHASAHPQPAGATAEHHAFLPSGPSTAHPPGGAQSASPVQQDQGNRAWDPAVPPEERGGEHVVSIANVFTSNYSGNVRFAIAPTLGIIGSCLDRAANQGDEVPRLLRYEIQLDANGQILDFRDMSGSPSFVVTSCVRDPITHVYFPPDSGAGTIDLTLMVR